MSHKVAKVLSESVQKLKWNARLAYIFRLHNKLGKIRVVLGSNSSSEHCSHFFCFPLLHNHFVSATKCSLVSFLTHLLLLLHTNHQNDDDWFAFCRVKRNFACVALAFVASLTYSGGHVITISICNSWWRALLLLSLFFGGAFICRCCLTIARSLLCANFPLLKMSRSSVS